MTDQTPPDPTASPSMEPEVVTPAAPAPAPAAAAPSAPPAAAPTSWTPPASAASGAAARPTGITILAVLAGIGGVLGLLGGFVVFLGGTVLFGALGGLLGLAYLAYAGLLLAFAYGAWTLKPWAWSLGVAVAAFGIILAVVYILGGSSFFSQVVSIAIDGGILYYLNQPGIKSVFGRA